MLVAVALSVLIGGTGWDAMLGNNLAESCEAWGGRASNDAATNFKTGACVGYIWGLAGAGEGSAFCFPHGVQANQIVDVIKKWLQDHPELRHYAASSLITAALKEKFPCN